MASVNDECILEKDEDSKVKFLADNRIDEQKFREANISWDLLVDIWLDHRKHMGDLSRSATLYANMLQEYEKVHSVRWRVKNPDHLVSKIIRKKISGNEKYQEIDSSNYHEIITDLIGIRALHLLKEDCSDIHKRISLALKDKEDPIAYVREGDSKEIKSLYEELGVEVKDHPEAYRSIHYVKTVRPMNRNIFLEIQVRTVFEEGWSEIDHQVRYPNYSNNPLIKHTSMLLNRIAGSADEMASYVIQLAASLEDASQAALEIEKDRDEAMQKIASLIEDLSVAEQGSSAKDVAIHNLKNEIRKINESQISNGIISSTMQRGLPSSYLSPSSSNTYSTKFYDKVPSILDTPISIITTKKGK